MPGDICGISVIEVPQKLSASVLNVERKIWHRSADCTKSNAAHAISPTRTEVIHYSQDSCEAVVDIITNIHFSIYF
jgi:hypothetical protein